MKIFVEAFLMFLAVGQIETHAAQQVVVPNNTSSQEGNSSVDDFLNEQSFRMQMVISASQFSSLSSAPNVSNILSAIYFRIDGATTAGMAAGFGGASVTLSATPRGPDNLSPIFAENIGANPVTVFSGGLPLGHVFVPGTSPQPFFLSVIAGNSDFHYSPADGNLLVDIRGVDGRVLLPGSLDAQSTFGDTISRVFAPSNLASSGAADTLGLVMRFEFVAVPEPSTWALMGFGVAFCLLLSRRKSRDSH